jgi:hypothetical protein
VETICDRCGQPVDVEDTSTPDGGEWEGATLCPSCFAEVGYDWDDEPTN